MQERLPKNNRREIFGWLTYDWANSAFYTTVVTVLVGPYLTALAQADVGKGGTVLTLGPLGTVTSDNMVTSTLGVSIFLQVFILPILGSIADYTHLKKKMMAFFCYMGVIASSLLFFIKGDSYVWGCILLVIANMSFAAANVFYNAFLVDLTTEDRRDRVSSYGFAAGYLGGVVMLVLNLAMINYASSLGVTEGEGCTYFDAGGIALVGALRDRDLPFDPLAPGKPRSRGPRSLDGHRF